MVLAYVSCGHQSSRLSVCAQEIKLPTNSFSRQWYGGLGTDETHFLKFSSDKTEVNRMENSQRMWQKSPLILSACLLLLSGHSPGMLLKEKHQ